MENCKIDRGSAFDCAAITQAGIGDSVYLINKEDIDNGTVTEDVTSGEIETIVLDTLTYAYKFDSSSGSLQIIPTSPLRKVTAIDGFDHSLDLRALDVSQLSKENIAKMRFQKVVAVVPLLKGGYLMYGRNVGMRIMDYQENHDSDTGGTIQFILKTPDNDPPEIAPAQLVESTFDMETLLAP